MNQAQQPDNKPTGTKDSSEPSIPPLAQTVENESLDRLMETFSSAAMGTLFLCDLEGDILTNSPWDGEVSALLVSTSKGRKEFLAAVRRAATQELNDAKVQKPTWLELRTALIMHESSPIGVVIFAREKNDELKACTQRLSESLGIDEAAMLHAIDRDSKESTQDTPAVEFLLEACAKSIAVVYAQAIRGRQQMVDLHVVHTLADMLSGTLDLQEVLDTTVRRVVTVMDVKACGIRLLNEETGELVIKAVYNLSSEYLDKGPVMLADNIIDATAFAGESVFVEDAPNDPRIRYPENARREGIVSGLCLPMTYRGQTVGVLRVYTGKRHLFNESEETLLRSIGSQAASAVINAKLHAEQQTADRVQRQVKVAGEIQKRTLPEVVPGISSLDFGCVYVPTLDVSGDFYDFIELDRGRWGVCVADVVGKGLPAALMMASVRAAVRAFAQSVADISAVMQSVNRHMCRETLVSEFATAVYGVLTPDGRTFTYSSGGHPPILVLRGDHFIELSAGGTVIGLDPSEAFESETITTIPGDIFVMYTDGIIEAMNFDDVEYGFHRLRASIWRHRHLDAQQLAKQILWDVRRFAGLADQSDDITAVVFKVR